MDNFFDYALWDLYEVGYWLSDTIANFMHVVYESDYGWMFYLALMPFVLTFCFDLIMSFILSVRLRELKLFNAFSPKSWRMVNETRNRSINNYSMSDLKNHPRDTFLKYTRLSSLAVYLKQYKNTKAGDIIRSKDGFKSVYQGAVLSGDGSIAYKYSTNSGIYYSTLKPMQWANSLGSERLESSVFEAKHITHSIASDSISPASIKHADIENRVINYMHIQSVEADEHKHMSKKYPSLNIVADDID